MCSSIFDLAPFWTGTREIMRHHILAAFSLLTLVFTAAASAQTLVSTTQAERFGLKRSWYTQAELNGVLDRVNHITPYVSSTQAVAMFDVEFDDTKFQFPVGAEGVKAARRAALRKHYDLRTAELAPRMYPIEIPGKDGAKSTPAYEVLVQKSKFRISQNDLDTFKKVLKVDGAKKKADEIVKTLEKVGVKAKIKTIVVPKVTLIVSTENGRVQAIDGETGRMLWSVPVGSTEHIMHKPSASDEYVVVTGGVTVHLLDIRDGQTKWTSG